MEWTWDEGKAESNVRKHGVRFEVAAAALDDQFRLTWIDRHPDNDRWRSYAMLGSVLFFIVHTDPDMVDGTPGRIISARRATPAERRDYAEKTSFS